MSFDVRTIPPFDRQAKRLAKRYASLRQDLATLIESLHHDPQQGDALGNGTYKLRVAISSKGKGKSGGARVITHLVIRQRTVYLIAIYDKSEQASLTKREITELTDQIPS